MRSHNSKNWCNAASAAIAAGVLCIAFLPPTLRAQAASGQPTGQAAAPAGGMSSYSNMRHQVDEKSMGAANTMPSVLNGVGIAQRLNEQLPLEPDLYRRCRQAGATRQNTSENGRQFSPWYITAAPCFARRRLDGLTSALEMVRFVPGKDFNIVIVSIDPTEGTDLAAAKKREYMKRYGHPETANGWHFLTGTQPNIDALTEAVGFKYVKLKVPGSNLMQFAHASAIQIVTPEGKLAQYYMGVEYSPKDLLLGLDEASSNRIGSPVDNILTYCYHYNPQTNTHSLIVSRVVQLGGLLTVILLGGFMTVMLRRDYRQEHQSATEAASKETKVNG